MFAEGKKCVAAKRCETFSKITEKWRRMREENNELQQRNANRYKGNAPRQIVGALFYFL